MIIDGHQRVHDYLRISLTDNCNLRCFYCMPDEEYEFTPTSKLMTAKEIVGIATSFVDLGVNKIRLTGGEPLVRKDAAEIILALSKLPVQLTITTNATRVHEFINVFGQAGITSVNISLDTLQEEKFLFITKRNQFSIVKNNIDLLLLKGFHVKINVVVMKGVNENEIIDFVAWTKDSPVQVRFIEFMPFSGNRWNSEKLFTLQQMLDIIETMYDIEPIQNSIHDTAKAFKVKGHAGSFAVISTMSDHFCAGCNRMRLTADGKMKNCLFSKDETDLLTALRNGNDIVPLIYKNIETKYVALGGQFKNDFENVHPEDIKNRSMITIGG